MICITFNDPPSGIYAGQVIDVCRLVQDEMKQEVTLLAFISVRGFKTNKQKTIEEGDFEKALKRIEDKSRRKTQRDD